MQLKNTNAVYTESRRNIVLIISFLSRSSLGLQEGRLYSSQTVDLVFMLYFCCIVIVLSSQLVPAALEIAMEEDVEFRKGLPLDYLTYMGVQNSDKVKINQLFCIYLSLPATITTTYFSPFLQ